MESCTQKRWESISLSSTPTKLFRICWRKGRTSIQTGLTCLWLICEDLQAILPISPLIYILYISGSAGVLLPLLCPTVADCSNTGEYFRNIFAGSSPRCITPCRWSRYVIFCEHFFPTPETFGNTVKRKANFASMGRWLMSATGCLRRSS